MEVKYEEMLNRVYSKLPPKVFEHRRFEIPKPQISIIGMRTVLHNFKEICETLNRDSHHFLRFLSRELATAGTLDDTRVIFQGRFSEDTIDRLIKRYAKEYVICPICKRPDTKIVKEGRFQFLVCEACGAKSSISST